MRRWKAWAGRTLALLWMAALACVRGASAHPMPNTELYLDVFFDRVEVELHVPLSELDIALRDASRDSVYAPLFDAPALRVAERHAALAAYFARHLNIRTVDGAAWSVTIGRIAADPTVAPPHLVAHATARPPPGGSTRRLVLDYDGVVHQLVTHNVAVLLRSDWRGGHVSPNHPELLGVIDFTSQTVVVARDGGSRARGFWAVFRQGMHHIAQGYDHLLFLVVLLLPAGFVAENGRWTGRATGREALRHLVRIVTAFTVGHSLTLVAGALGWVNLPERPVEILIAASILLTALHALRPLFPGREALVAAGFGLVHGLAFARLVSLYGLSNGDAALSLLAFNLGIEAMQLVVVALVFPFLWMLERTRARQGVRIAGAVFAAMAALVWFVQRLG